MSLLLMYLQHSEMRLSYSKTMMIALYINNLENKHELKVDNIDKLLTFCPVPAYLGVKLDRLVTFSHHLVALLKKYFHLSCCHGNLRTCMLVPKTENNCSMFGLLDS